MARLGSIEKAGYYPIPPEVTKIIFNHLKAPYSGRILDPCAGEGVALHYLANRLFLQPYGAELQTYRAEDAKKLIDSLLDDEYWQTKTALKDKGLDRMIPEDMINIRTKRKSMQLLYLNPPYDNIGEVDEDTGKTQRLELKFLQKMTFYLQHEGVLVFVIPQSILANRGIAEHLTAHYTEINTYRFPAGTYEAFKQVVLFAVKRQKMRTSYAKDRDALRDVAEAKQELRELDAYPTTTYELPRPKIIKIQYQGLFMSRTTIGQEHYRYGGHTNPEYKELFQSAYLQKKQPLMPFKVGHIGGLGAAGIFDEIVMKKDGETILIKGRIKKELVKNTDHSVDSKGNEKTVEIATEVPVTQVALLNQDGDVKRITPEELPGFFTAWLPQLTEAIDRDYKPLYKFPPFKGNAHAERIGRRGSLYPAQKHLCCAVAMRLEDNDNAIIVGQMGVGKTRIGAAIMMAIQARRVIVLSPPHLVPKWKREIEMVIPEANVIPVDRIGDVQKWMELDEQKQIQIGIIKFTSAGAASGWVPSHHQWELFSKKEIEMIKTFRLQQGQADGKVIEEEEIKPLPENLYKRLDEYVLWRALVAERGVSDSDMGEQLKNSKGFLVPIGDVNKGTKQYHLVRAGKKHTETGKEIVLSKERTRYNPLYHYKRHQNTSNKFLDFSEIATQYQKDMTNGNSSTAIDVWDFDHSAKVSKARWRIADYIEDHYSGRVDLLVVDEAHMAKADDTDRGYAMHRLACASKKTILMTGTIYGGKASTIFHLLYRTNPGIREAYTNKFEKGRKRINIQKWIHDYGMMEYRQITSTATTGSQSGNKRVSVTSREAPGSSPAMLTWLLNATAFLSLKDLGLALPSYEEIPIPIEPTDGQKVQVKLLEKKLGAEMRERLAKGDKSLLGIYLMANLLMPDAPWRDEIIIDPKTKGTPNPKVICHIPKLPERTPDGKRYPKEHAIIEQIKDSIFNKGRKVLLLCQQTRTRNITDKWVEWLRAEGLNPAVLNAPPATREKWIARKAKEGVNVLITHPRSVEVGLDLYDYPDIIWMGTEYSVYTIMQASRRSYRINQTQDVRVYFYYYTDTFQETALSLIIKKVAASQRVNGDVITSDTIANAVAGSIEDQLGRMIESNDKIGSNVLVHELFLQAKETQEDVIGYIGDYSIEEEAAAAPAPAPKIRVIEGEATVVELEPKMHPILKMHIDDAPPFSLTEQLDQEKRRLEFGKDKIEKRKQAKKDTRNPGQLSLFGG